MMTKPVLYIEPGEFVIGQHLEQCYKTILGSCVSMVMYEQQSSFFAMCHFLLPKLPVSNSNQVTAQMGRYGDQVLPEMIRQAKQANIDIKKLSVLLFGGSSSKRTEGLSQRFRIACNNLSYSHRFLRQHCLQLCHEDVGGSQGRSLIIDASSGEFFCNKVEQLMSGERYA
ncbi:chemotaxis protein CheD [Pseudoalteromonas mariniglutinosa]|uniref:chemotaxis protein CheD n=1 Tax=Pseudoalteromonas mariniglutinosa TaxID=206042 RepID=UPI00384D953B